MAGSRRKQVTSIAQSSAAGKSALAAPPRTLTAGTRCLRLCGVLLLFALAACAGTREKPVAPPAIQAEAMLGVWYIQANIPYFAERDKVATRVEYRARPDGRYDDLYYFRRSLDAPEERWDGVAWTLDASGSRWKARFIWPFSTEFWVLELAADGQSALIATPDKELAWIYTRQQHIETAQLESLTQRLASYGVDTSKLVRIPQR